MKSAVLFRLSFFVVTLAVCALCTPAPDNSKKIRVKRDLAGIFDSISNGFKGMVNGAKKMSNSVFMAFSGVFGDSKDKPASYGFMMFGNNLGNGGNNTMVTATLNPTASGGQTQDESAQNPPTPQPQQPVSEKSSAPEGHVPEDETT